MPNPKKSSGRSGLLAAIKARWLHVRKIGKPWWVMVAALWGMFWATDEIIAKWGSSDVKAFWDTYTSRLHFDWKIGIIGFLLIFVLMLIEGSFRHHRKTLATYEEALAVADDQHRKNLRSSLAAAEEDSHQALESALSTAEARHREELAAAQQKKAERDWAGDWKEHAGRFEPLTKSGIRVDSCRRGGTETWNLTGGDNSIAARTSTLCKHAGELLCKSPNVAPHVPPAILAMADPAERWFSYLKHAQPLSFRVMGYGNEEPGIPIVLGSISDLAAVSANQCLECAGREY